LKAYLIFACSSGNRLGVWRMTIRSCAIQPLN
jgi:hypothetical protein